MDEQTIFLTAVEQHSPADRAAFLDQACGTDSALRQRILDLLQKHDDLGSFLERPPLELHSSSAAHGSGNASTTTSGDSLSFLTPTEQPGCIGTLGPYEVRNVIGRGGMGIVLRALDSKLNRIVAVKVLAPELAANPNARKRFLREAQAAAAISHPHVVTIHAVEEGKAPEPHSTLNSQHSTLPYLVMECVVGQSLQEKLDRVGSLSVTEILRISHQIASGLAAAHQQGLIHRDIKPANILLENGVERVKITDFGLARLVDDVAITRTGEVSGTPQYMSPEQAKGDRVDHRSDLFSLGCVMYAMCTGHSPFRGDSLAAVIKRVTQDDPRPIEELNPDIPRWLCEIINRLLEKSPDHRFQTAGDLGELLGVHLARQQHAGPDAISHSGINARHLAPVPPQRHTARRPHRAATPRTGSANLIRVPGYLRLFGALLLIGGGVFVVGRIAMALTVSLNPAMEARMGDFQEHLLQALFFSLPAVVGTVLTRKWLSSQMMLGALFLGLGPLGLVIWLLRHEVWEEDAVDRESAREIDRRDGCVNSDFRTAVCAVGVTTVVAAWLTIGLSILLPVPDIVDFTGKTLVGAAFVAIVLSVTRPLLAARTGINRRHPLLLAGPVLWTLVGVPLLTIIGYDAIVVQDPDEPYVGLLILLSAVWLIPVAGMLYAVWRKDQQEQAQTVGQLDSTDARPATPGSVPPWLLGGLGLCAAGIAAMLLIDSDAQLPGGIGLVEGLVVLLAGSCAIGVPVSILWLLLRRRSGDTRTVRERFDDARAQPAKLLAWLAIGALLMFVVLPALYIGIGLIVPMLARVDPVRVAIDYDPVAPITAIETDRGMKYAVDSRPFEIRLPPGKSLLHFQYTAAGVTHYLSKTINLSPKAAGTQISQDLSRDIAADLARVVEPHLNQTGDYESSGGMEFGPGDYESSGGGDFGPGDSPDGGASRAAGPPAGDITSASTPSFPPSVAWTVDTDHHLPVRSGMTHIRMLSQGIVLALRKKSLFDGEISNEETLVSQLGDTYENLGKGEYQWLLRDMEFGWVVDLRGALTLLDPAQGTLVVQRNLEDVIGRAGVIGHSRFSPGEDPRFRWNGVEYKLDWSQAWIVQRLARAMLTDQPEISEQSLVDPFNRGYELGGSDDAGSYGDSGSIPELELPLKAVKDLFVKRDKVHPAWGRLIVPGIAPGTHRLAPINQGTVSFNQTDDIRSVVIHTKTGTLEYLEPGERNLSLAVGEYGVEFIPIHPDVAWMRPSSVGYLAYMPSREVTLEAGGEVELDLTPQLTDALTPRPFVNQPEQNPTVLSYSLRWYGIGDIIAETQTPSDAGPDANDRLFALNHPQAHCISRLIRAIIEDKPDVLASELLEIATQNGFAPTETDAGDNATPPFRQLFPELDNAPWTDLLTPGDEPDTWRLKVPPPPN